MKASTKEILELAGLLWWELSEVAMGRTMRALTHNPIMSREQSQLAQRAQRLGYLSRTQDKKGQWVWDISAELNCKMMGDLSPDQHWSEKWDGRWTLVTFDLPREKVKTRNQLHYLLKKLRFGCLQGSVWISPRSCEFFSEQIKEVGVSRSELCLFVAKPNESDNPMIEKAWKWEKIQEGYDLYRGTLKKRLREFDEGKVSLGSLVLEDSSAWRKASSMDPFLPRDLCPKGYSGFNVWEYRKNEIGKRVKI